MYMRLLLLNNEDPTGTPRIKVSTIHGAKGGEATNVVLFLNEHSRIQLKVQESLLLNVMKNTEFGM